MAWGNCQIYLKYNIYKPYLYNEEMKDKRWVEIVNACCLWPLLLARVSLHMGELTQGQLLI
jgi:hypothetical protein